jgi:luciferase-like monooxygenase
MSTDAQARITAEVGSWPGVTVEPHRFGGVQYQLGRRELGHMHGDHVADLPFPRRIRDELIAEGRADRHHALPDSGWVTYRLRGDEDVARAIELFRLGYERALAARRG